MKTVNYEVADATILLSYAPKILDENAIDEEEVAGCLICIFNDMSRVMGMNCDVTEEIGVIDGHSVWKLHLMFQQASDSSGAEKEMDRIVFLETLADFESQIIQTEDVLKVEGVKFDVQMAAHNKAEYQLYQMEMAEPFIVEQQQEKFAGDVKISFWLNIDKVEQALNRDQDKVDHYLNLMRTSLRSELDKIGLNAAVLSDELDMEQHLWGAQLRIIKNKDADLSTLFLDIKTLQSELEKDLAPFENASHLEMKIHPSAQKFYESAHFISDSLN